MSLKRPHMIFGRFEIYVTLFGLTMAVFLAIHVVAMLVAVSIK